MTEVMGAARRSESKVVAVQSICIEKMCCQIRYRDGQVKLFVLNIDDLFARRHAEALATDQLALQSTTRVSRFFANWYRHRLLSRHCFASDSSNVSIVSRDDIFDALRSEWMDLYGTKKIEVVEHEGSRLRVVMYNACPSIPREMLERRATEEWRLVTQTVAQYGVDRSDDIQEIRLGSFDMSVQHPLVDDEALQANIDEETRERWDEGMRRLNRGLRLFKDKTITANNWSPTRHLIEAVNDE